MIEWVCQLGGRRGTSCFPLRVGGGGRGAPPGVISQARGATSSSVGRPSFLRLLSYGVGRAARHAPPLYILPAPTGLEEQSSFKMSQFIQFSSVARVQVCAWRAMEGGNLSRASRRKTLPLACCRVRCGRSRCLRSRVRGRDALLSQAFPGSQQCMAGGRVLCRSLCSAGLCWANVACVLPNVHTRWVKRDPTHHSSCVHA